MVRKEATVFDKTFEAGKMKNKLAEMMKVLKSIEERIENGRNIREGRKSE